MATRGRKPQLPSVKAAKGETRPSRTANAVTVLYPDHASRPDPEKIKAPAWLTAPAKKIWDAKCERYRQRAQKIGGFEDSLAQYCALEADLIDMRKKRIPVPAAMLTAHRVWAGEFYDTPASQTARPGQKPGGGNKFGGIGSPPDKK